MYSHVTGRWKKIDFSLFVNLPQCKKKMEQFKVELHAKVGGLLWNKREPNTLYSISSNIVHSLLKHMNSWCKPNREKSNTKCNLLPCGCIWLQAVVEIKISDAADSCHIGYVTLMCHTSIKNLISNLDGPTKTLVMILFYYCWSSALWQRWCFARPLTLSLL